MFQQQTSGAPVRVKEEIEDAMTEVVMLTQNCARINAFNFEAQQISIKQEPQIESHPLPVPSTSSSLSSSHFIKRPFNAKISSVLRRKQRKKCVNCLCDGCLGLVAEDDDCHCDKCEGLELAEEPDEDVEGELLLTDEEDEKDDPSGKRDYRNTEVNTDSSDDESGNSHDQHENAQLNNSAVAAPIRPTQNRALSPETNNATDSHKRTKPASYRCTVPDCGRVYQTRHGLYEHQVVHSGKFTCEQCGKRCPSNFHLKQHQLTHSDTKPHKCTECQRAFSQKSHLTTHQRSHSGEKPFQCTYCDKSFTRSGQLIVHLRMHTHDRPYKCTYCSYVSAYKSDLTRHLRLHSGQLPYQCEQCSKRFNQKGQLTRHMRNNHC